MKELRHLNKYFYKYRLRVIAGIFFVAISNLFGIYPAQVVRHAVDEVVVQINTYKTSAIVPDAKTLAITFGVFFLIILGLAILKGVFMFFMRQTIIVVSRYIEYDLKNEIYQHYQELNTSFYRKNNTGDLMNRIGEDVSRVRMYVGPSLMYLVNLIVLFILAVATMLSINVKLTLYALLPLPLLAVSIYYVNSIIHDKSERIQEQLSTLSTYVQETFAGIRVLKAYTREQSISEHFAVESEDYKTHSLALARVQSLFFPLMVLLIGLSIILTIYIGGLEVIKGTISPGNIAEFVVYVTMLTWPVTSLGWVTSLVQRAAASQKRINEFLQIQPEIQSEIGSQNIQLKGHIVFKNVSFTYPDTGITALRNISFEVNPGELLAIIGRTGTGKSTIIALLMRQYDPTEGTILIDGIDIKDLNLRELRKQIGIVPQDVFLFSDTIANNIAFGEEQASMARIEQAAKDAAIYHNIAVFPESFATRIGERGITLSGGQKQRISIARALIKEPQLLLLDDCLSAVDTKTEEEILQNLGRIMANKTSILISHRISTIKNATKILVLDNGSIAESGTHDTLLKAGKIYAELHEKQLLEEII